jgi:hypothetical protein
MPEQLPLPWAGPSGISIPSGAQSAGEIVPLAAGLRPAEQQRVISAFQNDLYDMGAEYVWRRAVSRLRQTIVGLGMRFVGEMLGREDVDDSSLPDTVLTDHDTIRLAEALGVVSATGALKLRHSLELLAHYAAGHADEALPLLDAVTVVRSCVQYALGEESIQVAVDFARFRERLVSSTVDANDPQLDLLATQPPFFVSTAVRALLAAVKVEQGARLQHALANMVTILPLVWERLPESDRWSIGSAYAEATAAGTETVVADLKRAMLKVAGFDYVPENLRSHAYRKAAQAVLDAHFAFDNFYGEVAPVRFLASLGSVIPKPAVPECLRALLCVYLGNVYGFSFQAAPIAEAELGRVTGPMWEYYWTVVFPSDEDVLSALTNLKPAQRLTTLWPVLRPIGPLKTRQNVARLLKAAEEGKPEGVRSEAMRVLVEYKSVRR